MAKIKPGDEVTWIDVCPDGSVTPRRGLVWSQEGDDSWWVVEESFGETVRVLRAPRRVATGIEAPMAEHEEYSRGFLLICGSWQPPRRWRPGMTKWVRDGGPVLKKGTLYREVDRRSTSMMKTMSLREQHEREMKQWARR